ncbi:hypothetical protein OG607_34690 [Streptomyces sp. NBC_01537]|uniref:hypothetical protein n=1 Tax=Streptomyces sp. NBC_01537 TaxID=2903896 RepID=UPI0038654DA3
MGYTVLYIAFGVVALWLLGEVLLQYKARLRWRLLAFAGFLGVVLGVYLPSVIVIGAGAVAFATGQTFVTLSYRKGFSTGWAIRRGGDAGEETEEEAPAEPAAAPAGRSRRRAKGGAAAAEPLPVEQELSVESEAQAEELAEQTAAYNYEYDASVFDSTQVYQPVPLLEDSGEFPVYDGQSSYTPDPYTSGGYEGYGVQGYGNDWQQQPQPQTAAWDSSQQTYGYADPYAQQQSYGYDTPADGVWAPQQDPGQQQQQQQQPYIPPQQQPQPDQPQYADPYDPYRY